MRKFYTIYWLYLFLLLGCRNESSDSNNSTSSDNKEYSTTDNQDNSLRKTRYINDGDSDINEDEEKYPDGTYCAEVEYNNPNTGTSSSYTLTVEVESNEVTEINWPNGGWLDGDHFSGADLEEDGSTSFTSDKGYDYEIQIIGKSRNCFVNVPKARRCVGTTRAGAKCRNMTDNSNGLCWEHQKQENEDLEDNSSDKPESNEDE